MKLKTGSVHKRLGFEHRRVQEAEVQLDFLNKVYHELDNLYGADFVYENVSSYGCGIEFKELDKTQYNAVKEILKDHVTEGLDSLKKDSNHYSIKMRNTCIIGTIDRVEHYADGTSETFPKRVDMTVTFKWGIPDTCEIVNTEVREEIDQASLDFDDDGKVYAVKIEKSLKCNKPLLEAVFDQKETVSANA